MTFRFGGFVGNHMYKVRAQQRHETTTGLQSFRIERRLAWAAHHSGLAMAKPPRRRAPRRRYHPRGFINQFSDMAVQQQLGQCLLMPRDRIAPWCGYLYSRYMLQAEGDRGFFSVYSCALSGYTYTILAGLAATLSVIFSATWADTFFDLPRLYCWYLHGKK